MSASGRYSSLVLLKIVVKLAVVRQDKSFGVSTVV